MVARDLLVRFQDRTYLFRSSTNSASYVDILLHVSDQTKWPIRLLHITQWDPPFCTVRAVSSLRGGKGGFGTLLKGQSRQAGAKTTTDFGLSRDLQGRRLRHVNEQIGYQLWKEWQQKVETGQATQEEMAKALIKSDSGIAGWHLQVPAWSQGSFKAHSRQVQRQFHQWRREEKARAEAKERERAIREQQVLSYIKGADKALSMAQKSVMDAVQQGLLASKKRKAPELEPAAKDQPDTTEEDEPPTAFMTLSGDVDVQKKNGIWQVGSASNFGTMGIMLQSPACKENDLYFEVVVRTGGLVQVGWAISSFRPDSEEGDGVGDCLSSWAYDGSRQIKLHGEEESYGEKWQAGDVIGCHYRSKTREISYFLNGNDLGVAFCIDHDSQSGNPFCYPAVSCNPGESVELQLFEDDMKYPQDAATCIGAIMIDDGDDVDLERFMDNANKGSVGQSQDESAMQQAPGTKEPSNTSLTSPEPLDLDEFDSIEQLEQMGLDRLKSALMAVGLKSGGSLRERAARLFSVKGLAPKDFPSKLLATKR